MRAVVAGGGPVGYFVAQELHRDGHEVTVVCPDRADAEAVAQRLMVTALHGDPSDPVVLDDAGASDVDVFVALCGYDPATLVACKLARARGARRVVALVNAPGSRALFEALGFRDVVSSAEVLGSLIRQETGFQGLLAQLSLRRGGLSLLEVRLPERAPGLGRPIAELPLPADALIVGVLRGESVLVARGPLVLEEGDELLIAARAGAQDALLKALIGGGR